MKIRIKSTPPGEAPEHIRQAWIGLEIPVPSRFAGRCRAYGFGVLSGPKTRFGSLLSVLIGRAKRKVGYVVEARVAIDLLASHSPEAADWWRQSTPRFLEPGRFFLFATESCEVIPETAA
jgi:hypothetical protein